MKTMSHGISAQLDSRQIEFSLSIAAQIVRELRFHVGDGSIERTSLPFRHTHSEQNIEMIFWSVRRAGRGVARAGFVRVEEVPWLASSVRTHRPLLPRSRLSLSAP
jgi:hypothetical protein